MKRSRLALLPWLAFLYACADAPTEVRSPAAPPSFLRAGVESVACATEGATVVDDEAALRAALATAKPGDVVAVSGMISVNSPVEVAVGEGVTLTCAHEGAGLVAPTRRFFFVFAAVPNVTVSGLAIKGGNSDWPVYILNGHLRTDVTGVRVQGNEVECGWAGCAFIIGAPQTTITGNSFTTVRSVGTGIHMQGLGQLRVDGSAVTNNVITAHAAVGSSTFGAIRPRDGTRVVVRGNVIRGPWSNGIALTEIQDGVFEHNTIEAVTQFGIFFALIQNAPITVRGTLFRANDITSTGGAAVFAQRACNNVFVGNRLTPAAGHPTIAFATTTGANVVLGSASGIEDNGSQDCDGDGVADPNSISGKTRRGGYAGEIIAPVMQNAGGTHAR